MENISRNCIAKTSSLKANDVQDEQRYFYHRYRVFDSLNRYYPQAFVSHGSTSKEGVMSRKFANFGHSVTSLHHVQHSRAMDRGKLFKKTNT